MVARLFSGIALALLIAATPSVAAPKDHARSETGRPQTKVPFPPIKDFSTLKIQLHRTACYGWCPVYSVEITGDGTVTWFGEEFVEAKGSRTAKIPLEKVRRLYEAFAAADFFWTFASYRAPITDLPTQIVTIAYDGHSKTVEDYAGGHVGMPKAIDDLEDAIDAAAGTQAWIGNTRQP